MNGRTVSQILADEEKATTMACQLCRVLFESRYNQPANKHWVFAKSQRAVENRAK